jgi:glycerol-1-phosphate dehydrogenase [NAD(P)+]
MAPIDDILRDELLGRSFDCECGRRHHVPTRVVDTEPGTIDRVSAILGEVVEASSALVVADRRTWRVAGERAHGVLRTVIAADHVVLGDGGDGQLHASVESVDRLEAATAGDYELYVAVGSGTVNDITKELARRRGRPYIVVATAASMNGYTSSIVALLDRGLKTTGPAAPPLAVVAEPELLAAAPLELTLAGLGDLVSKPYCGCDWWIASLLRGEAFCSQPQRILGDAFDSSLEVLPRLADRDPEVVALLAKLLIVSGITMTIAGSSSPASGGEHLLSHYWDMTRSRDGRALNLHGAQVGVASLALDALYARILDADFGRARFARDPGAGADEQELSNAFGSLAGAVRPQWRAKLARRSERDLELLQAHEADIKAEIAVVLESGRKVRAAMAGSGAPMWAAELGITRAELAAALRHGRMIRDRFTVLDLAAELGLLEAFAADYPDRNEGWLEP